MATMFLLILAGLHGAVAVAVGAYAAHGMDTTHALHAIAWVETGSHYQLVHAAAMLGTIAVYRAPRAKAPRVALAVAGFLFALGGLLFPGALYALAFLGDPRFGAVAPIGGAALILGWLAIALAGAMTAWTPGTQQEPPTKP